MATEDKDMNDYAAGFGDEREGTRSDEDTFKVADDAPADGAPAGGMDLDAAAAADPGTAGTAAAGGEGGEGAGAPAAGAEPMAAGDKIERQPEGGGAATADAADNGGGGNEDGASGGLPAQVDVVVMGSGGGDDTPITDASAAAPDAEADDEPSNEKDIQRKKSWEGRLKAEETRLKALAAELESKGKADGAAPGEATADALDAVAEQTNDPSMIEAAEDMSQRVESGEISAEDAMAQLEEDFGSPFVKLIKSVAAAAAGEALQSVRGDLDKLRGDTEGVIEHLSNEGNKRHYEAVAAQFPDFNEINKSPEFEAFLDAMPPDEKADAERVRQGGSTGEVIALLKAFKGSEGDSQPVQEKTAAAPAAATPPTVGASDDEIDAAAGVRGGGMSLPSEPASENDFAAGWDDTPDVKTGRG